MIKRGNDIRERACTLLCCRRCAFVCPRKLLQKETREIVLFSSYHCIARAIFIYEPLVQALKEQITAHLRMATKTPKSDAPPCNSKAEFQSCMYRILALKEEVKRIETSEVCAELSRCRKEINALRKAVLPWFEQHASHSIAPEDRKVVVEVGDKKVVFERKAVRPVLQKAVAKAPGPRDALTSVVMSEQQMLAVCDAVFDMEQCCSANGDCAPYEAWREKWAMRLPANKQTAASMAALDDGATELTGAYDRDEIEDFDDATEEE